MLKGRGIELVGRLNKGHRTPTSAVASASARRTKSSTGASRHAWKVERFALGITKGGHPKHPLYVP
jgi:hypothetical protein